MSHHQNKSGDKVSTSGIYKNRYGKTVNLEAGENFPLCPEKGLPTEWQKVD